MSNRIVSFLTMTGEVMEKLGTKTYQGVSYTFYKVGEEEVKKGFLGKFGDKITGHMENTTEAMAEKTAELIVKTLGYTIFSIATIGKQLAILGVIVGVYLLFFKNTKVIRYSILGYIVSIILELIGMLLIG